MRNITIQPQITIRQAMKKMSQAGERCLVIVDENYKLLGTLSDGDVRKTILKGTGFGESIESIYHKKPTFFVQGEYSVEDAIRGLCKAFREGKLPNSLNDEKYFNVRTMKKIGAA